MRIAINAIGDLGSRYGSGVYLVELSCELSKMDGIDLMLLVAAGEGEKLPEMLKGNSREVNIPSGRSYLQILYQYRIREILLRERIDVYLLPNTLPLLWRFVPTVMSIHDLAELRVRKYGYARTIYRRFINFLGARICDHVLTLSENSKRDIVRYLRIPESKVSVTWAGVDGRFRMRERHECKNRVRAEFGIETDYLLAPGGFSRNKNIETLLLSMAILRDMGNGISLVLTGHGSKEEVAFVASRIRSLNLGNTVRLTGYVGVEDMPFLYGASSVVVYPSIYEGFGLPVIEGMASGIPVIAANTSALPEVVGDAGVLIDPYNPTAIAQAVWQVLNDEGLRMSLISRGLDRAKQFTWRRTAEKIVQACKGARNETNQPPDSLRGKPQTAAAPK